MTILKQRIYTRRLPTSFQLLDHSIDNIEQMLKRPAFDRDKRATLLSRPFKTITQFKYDLMVLAITTAEETVRCHTKIIVDEKKKLVDTAHGQVSLPKPLVELMNTVAARQSNILQRHELILKQKLSVFDDAPIHILPSSPITEAASSLSSKQLSFFTNGPKYIAPCQNRFSYQPVDIIINKEYENIIQCFKIGLSDNCVSTSDQRAKYFFADIEHLLRRLYTTPLPHKLQIRAQYEQRMIRSIQHGLRQSAVVIRKIDKSKGFHLGSADDYHRKALEYMQKTNAYEEISSAHLYFIPKPYKVNTPLRPIVSSIQAAATGVSHFLDKIIRPLYDRVAKPTTFSNDIDFVRQLEQFRDEGRLLPTTLFITFDVTDLYTMIPRDRTLAALGCFLDRYSTEDKISDMTIDTIMKMARLVINTNCFAFENKYYRQIRGGAMGSPLTMTLANIYM
ncbi:unnamed protein product [Rotaria sordida]|uniref:Reverse transcriptase domain-containing protein n=1 Tax=Rotaria sordida TaxID=392033 RepID=A0A815G2S6_9BILA|nr:unnamed protein product [Rotaria sordida]